MPSLGSCLSVNRRSKLSAAGWPLDVKKFNVCEHTGVSGVGTRAGRFGGGEGEKERKGETLSWLGRKEQPGQDAVYCERARTVGKKTGRRRSIFLITSRVQPERLGRFSLAVPSPFPPSLPPFPSPQAPLPHRHGRPSSSSPRGAYNGFLFLLFETVLSPPLRHELRLS